MTTVAIYTRVSTTDKHQTITNQRDPLLTYCTDALGVPAPQEYSDNISAVKIRPAYEKMLAAAKAGTVGTIVTWKLDRMFRSVHEFARVTLALREQGTRLIIPSQGIDTDASNPAAKFLMTILAAVAEFERDLISERVRAGMIRAKKGEWKDGKPGKKRVYDVVRISELRAAGMSIREIAAETGIGKTLIHRVLRQMPGDPKRPPPLIGGLVRTLGTRMDAELEQRRCEQCSGFDGHHDPRCPVTEGR